MTSTPLTIRSESSLGYRFVRTDFRVSGRMNKSQWITLLGNMAEISQDKSPVLWAKYPCNGLYANVSLVSIPLIDKTCHHSVKIIVFWNAKMNENVLLLTKISFEVSCLISFEQTRDTTEYCWLKYSGLLNMRARPKRIKLLKGS